MAKTEYQFTADELEAALPSFAEKKITELTVRDAELASNRGRLIRFMQAVERHAPDLFVILPVNIEVVDRDLCAAAQKINCSLDIPLAGKCAHPDAGASAGRAPAYLFDKKLYARKADLLNQAGLVFGFDMDYAVTPGDSLHQFRDRLDFALSLYPNHIDFAQLADTADAGSAENDGGSKIQSAGIPAARPTGTFSSQEIKLARDLAFACAVFYSAGRAVPWFLAVLKPLKIQSTNFLADFAEWQRIDNCGASSGFDPEAAAHADIEKMQLVFLKQKYEEKHRDALWPLVNDFVRLNGAFARAAGEGAECTLNTQYNPDDLLGPQGYDLAACAENACEEPCRVKVFAGEDGPDYKIL